VNTTASLRMRSVPALGVAGGGVAVVVYYLVGTIDDAPLKRS
jgi:hypothetical protein